MPKILPIITNPDPKLREKNREIEIKDIKLRKFSQLCADMSETMLEKDGVGLAAPQVGENIRLIVVNTKDGPVCIFNPLIRKKFWARERGEEGCLSVPGVFGEVRRHKKISYEYYDIEGNKIKTTAKGFFARVLQHEVDHLNGILFIDKARDIRMHRRKDTRSKDTIK